jgi:uncharacterized membrane protein YedE/YeeE
MMSLLFIILWLGVGFFAGMTYGTQRGYDQAVTHLNAVVDKLEKLYQEKINRLEKIIRERLINKV